MKAGIVAAGSRADAAIVGRGDQPFLTSDTVDRLVEAHRSTKAPVVVPVYHGRRGNPVLFDRSLFPQIMRIHGDMGARSVVRDNESSLLEVEVEDQGVIVDLDTPSDYKEQANQGGSRRTKSQGLA